MLAAKNFISFIELPDRSHHRTFNEWHHLDHRPENLMLRSVLWGERWVRTPDCVPASTSNDPRFDNFHYMNIYWFPHPVEESLREFHELGARSFQWGRRPELAFVKRPFVAEVDPVKGYVNPRVLVSADVLPARPNLGVHITVAEYSGGNAELDDLFRWYDQVHLPDLLECAGAAGIWSFVSENHNIRRRSADQQNQLTRIYLTFLDEDPLKFVADRAAREPAWRSEGRWHDHGDVESILFSGPLRLIRPFEYDWFD